MLSWCLLFYSSRYSLVASFTYVYLISFLTLLFRLFFVVSSLFVYFVAFNFFLPSVFLFSVCFLIYVFVLNGHYIFILHYFLSNEL